MAAKLTRFKLTHMSIVKELSCRWIMSTYDHIRSFSEIVKNGFNMAGITSAVENGVELPEDLVAAESSDSEDSFSSDNEWSGDTDE